MAPNVRAGPGVEADYRRRPPPPPDRLRLPRELAARSDLPLEYPEKASDFVPLRSADICRPSVRVVPRASALALPRDCAVALVVLAVLALAVPLRACVLAVPVPLARASLRCACVVVPLA